MTCVIMCVYVYVFEWMLLIKLYDSRLFITLFNNWLFRCCLLAMCEPEISNT